MKRTNLFFGLAFALFCSLPMYAQTVSEDVDINTTSESATPRFVNMFINDNGAIYPIYVPNLSENTKIQEVWNEASAILGTRYFDLYYNGQKLSLDKSFADYWITGNISVYLEGVKLTITFLTERVCCPEHTLLNKYFFLVYFSLLPK